MTRPLLLDTDGGVDDAQALLLLLAHGRAPEAITTVFGNVGLPAATRNVLDVLALAGADVPVHAGAAGPLVGRAIDAREIHGEDGLGGAPRPPAAAAPASRDGVGFLVGRLGRAARDGAPVDLLAIGPLTNLALALRLRPDVAAGIGHLVVMGGTLWGRGNATPAAEFNVLADPEAASAVLSAGLPTTLVPWEPCRDHSIAGAEAEAMLAGLPDDPLGRLNAALLRHARAVVQGHGRPDLFRFVDPFAAAVLVEPGLVVASLAASVDVALAPGIARGMTVVDPSGRLGSPPVTLVERGDVARLKALFAASLAWRPR